MRNCDLRKSLIRSEGIYDVLDHATATCGYGGKAALDLTNVEGKERKATFDNAALPAKIEVREDLLAKWSTLVLFADNDLEIDAKEIVKATDCNFVVVFDKRASKMSAEELLWLGAANTEPSRDFALCGSTLFIDARPKHHTANDKNPPRWPNIVTADEDTIARVDNRWSKYGIGEFIPSPSLRYRELQLSEGAQWE